MHAYTCILTHRTQSSLFFAALHCYLPNHSVAALHTTGKLHKLEFKL